MANSGASSRVQDALKRVLTTSYMLEIGAFAASLVKLRTQLGFGVSSQGSPREKLKPLSKAYQAQRAKGNLSEYTSPSKSNLTRTGQLLSSIRVKTVSRNSVTVGPVGIRNDGKDNEQIGEYVSEQGRPFNHLSDVEVKRVREKIRKDIQAAIRVALRVK